MNHWTSRKFQFPSTIYKVNTLLYFIFFLLIITCSHLALKTVWILISWLLQKPADLDLYCFQEKPADQDPYCLQELIYIWFHTVFERYKLFFFFPISKIFNGQVHFGFLLAPGQVETFTIFTPLGSLMIHEILFCHI